MTNQAPTPAPRVPFEETLHGVTISDPYRWLEDGESQAVRDWVEAQNRHTEALLDAVPGREELRRRLTELMSVGGVGSPSQAGRYSFFVRREGAQNQPVLYVREGYDGPARALLDPNPLSADGTVAVDWWYPSDDGRLLAYGISSAGDEKSTLYVLDVATGEKLDEAIPNTRYASVAWLPDNSGFYYTRYPEPGTVPEGEENYHQRAFFHALGSDPAADPEIFGAGRNPQDSVWLTLSRDGRYLLAGAFQGWSRSELYLRDLGSDAGFLPVAEGVEALFSGMVVGDQLYIFTNEGAPNYRLFVTDARTPTREHWREVIPESETVLQQVVYAGGRLATVGLRNATSLLRIYDADGRLADDVVLPSVGSVGGLAAQEESDELLFVFTSFFERGTIYRYSMGPRLLQVYERIEAEVDASEFVAEQVWYESRDGTRVSMFVAHRRDVERNGANPTLLYGYGGFNISMTPAFSSTVYHWLERGGVYAVANLRGGGEYGETWHRDGMLERKQNVFDDFIAAAEWLIDSRYTNPERLAIQGGSNGGLLVGAVMVQRPELFKAVVCQVPLLDMLRYHLFRIGKLWIPEYGCAEDEEQFRWLHAYSPYHNVRRGARYPAILLAAAESDGRVDPLHARKMAALLQEASDGESPVLLRIETRAGHGQGKPLGKVIDEAVDIWSFILGQLRG